MKRRWALTTHYQVLQVPIAATTDEINSAYRKLMRRYHPDLNSGTDELAAKVTLAHSILSDSFKRSEYDRSITAQQQQPTFRDPSVIKVAPPMEFGGNVKQQGKAIPRRRSSSIKRIWSHVGGRIAIVTALVGLAAWAASAALGINFIAADAPLGLSSFTIGVFASTVLVLLVNPIKHPWMAAALLILAFLIPIDYINGDNLLPNLLASSDTKVVFCIAVAYVSSVVFKFCWLQMRRISQLP